MTHLKTLNQHLKGLSAVSKTSIKIGTLVLALTMTSCSTTKEEKNEEVLQLNEIAMANPAIVVEEVKVERPRSVVFIAGYDKGGKTYFSDAKSFFQKQDAEIVETAYSLQEMILWLNVNKKNKPFSEIHIVANNKLSKVQLETTVKGDLVSSEAIKTAVVSGLLPKLENVLEKDAKVVLHSAGLGSQVELVDDIQEVFSSDVTPSVIASENISVFGGQFSEHFMAKPYYVFYPTANSPGRVDLSKELKATYPEAEIDWLSAMNNPTEKFQGDIYSYKFNIPVKWEIAYENDEDIPSFRTLDQMYAFMQDHDEISKDLEALKVPIEKFRWFQTVKGDKLVIKGKVTVVCVLEPVMSPAYPSEYMKPTIENLRLYNRI